MDLRAVPVRCLAMDKVAASIVPSLTAEQQQQYAKRKQDGQSAADKVNKMFWYLAPTALPGLKGPQALPLQRPASHSAASCMPLSAAAASDFLCSSPSPAALPTDPKTSNGLQGMTAALHTHHHQQQHRQQFITPLLQLGRLPPAGAAAVLPHLQSVADAAPLLQLAMAAQHMSHAQQVAHAQQLAQVQQQLGAVSLDPACRTAQAGVAAGMAGCISGHHDACACLGMGSQPLCLPGYQGLQQLSSMLGSMCQV
ncbi:hypothetical protein COO60DRAFT_1068765 [Scenedesmus sp. NREL 46B-D3]|nr:hypothetical protein COO60DRAFT_1068765 [Scenedesmus sp. NREL 46B-D3]